MCGKLNPTDRDTCQYCQARLKPLVAGAPSEPQSPPSQPPAKPEAGTPPGKPDLEKQEGSSLVSPGAGDWLSDLRSDESLEAGPEESDAASGASDFGDWFSRLEEPAAAQPAQPPGKPDLEKREVSSLASPEKQQPEEEASPDWLKGSTETPAPPAGEAADPDWLHQFQAVAAEEAAPEPGIPALGASPAKPSEDSGKIGATDWLSGLSALAAPAEEETGAAGIEEELPDWMKPAADRSVSPQPGMPQEGSLPDVSAPSQEALPDWMHEAGSEPAVGEPADSGAEETEKPALFGDLPDWLAAQKPPTAQEEAPATFTETGAEQEIDWSQAETPSGLPTGVPDWLAEGSAPTEGTFAAPAEAASEPAAEESPTDWFSKLGITSAEQPAGKPDLGVSPGKPDLRASPGKPDLGASQEATPAFVMNDADMAPFVSGDEMSAAGPVSGDLESLPDWLSQVQTEQPAPAPEAPPQRATSAELEAQAESDLAPAQLPTWLEAMRPVESAAPTIPTTEEGPTTIETAGPLAGLRGILPAEVEIARIRKPPVYSVKLQVSEAHQARVSLLQELVASEGQPKPVVPHAAIASQTALRLVIALLLVLAVVGALWMGGDRTSLPDPSTVPPELESLRGQIEALSTDVPVLVAFDYDPGFSGEMEASASAVISHLIEKQVPLVFVSTNPFGPALAERLVKRQVNELNSQLLPNTTPYTTSLFTNLGYIPGGIAGLRAFADTPAQILPISLDGQDIWTTAPLTPSMTLSGFAQVLVITDNPDTARAWIEQAGPALKPSPLLMIVSAQAEPLIRPYSDSGQVQGMMAGLAGGAAYENKRGLSGLASKSWDAFSAGLLVATIVILIGGLVNASLASMSRNKHKGEEQPYA